MRIFVCDAFSSEIFKGNQAGVVILEEKEEYPTVTLMKNIAAELKHSETAFVKKICLTVAAKKTYLTLV